MTREEAIKNIKEHCYFANLIPQAKEALDMAIKSLEHEDILDKIRAIVDEWQSDTWTDNLSYECMVKIAELVKPEESEE